MFPTVSVIHINLRQSLTHESLYTPIYTNFPHKGLPTANIFISRCLFFSIFNKYPCEPSKTYFSLILSSSNLAKRFFKNSI